MYTQCLLLRRRAAQVASTEYQSSHRSSSSSFLRWRPGLTADPVAPTDATPEYVAPVEVVLTADRRAIFAVAPSWTVRRARTACACEAACCAATSEASATVARRAATTAVW